MQTLPSIQLYYRPIQPAAAGDTSVSYTEYAPHPALAAYIYCYWELSGELLPKEHYDYRVVSDGCIDIIVDKHRPEDAIIVGFSALHTIFHLQGKFRYMGIRFLPGAFPLLFGIRASELSNGSEALGAVHPQLTAALREIGLASPDSYRAALDDYFLRYIFSQSIHTDARIFEAIAQIVHCKGILNIETDITTGLSQRQLRRHFDFYIGASPKQLSNVVRFQHILAMQPTIAALRHHKLFYDAGYYDQAHFIKEFKAMYGLTPLQAFR